MEPPKTPALSSPSLDLHPLPEEPLEINTEFCEESVTYSELRIHYSSNTQNENVTRSLKIKESSWALAALVFACLYLIVLVIAAIMIAKARHSESSSPENKWHSESSALDQIETLVQQQVQYLERMLKAQESNLQNETAH